MRPSNLNWGKPRGSSGARNTEHGARSTEHGARNTERGTDEERRRGQSGCFCGGRYGSRIRHIQGTGLPRYGETPRLRRRTEDARTEKSPPLPGFDRLPRIPTGRTGPPHGRAYGQCAGDFEESGSDPSGYGEELTALEGRGARSAGRSHRNSQITGEEKGQEIDHAESRLVQLGK